MPTQQQNAHAFRPNCHRLRTNDTATSRRTCVQRKYKSQAVYTYCQPIIHFSRILNTDGQRIVAKCLEYRHYTYTHRMCLPFFCENREHITSSKSISGQSKIRHMCEVRRSKQFPRTIKSKVFLK